MAVEAGSGRAGDALLLQSAQQHQEASPWLMMTLSGFSVLAELSYSTRASTMSIL